MSRREESAVIRVSSSQWLVDDSENDQPRYTISVVSARSGVHVKTIRRYEQWGLVEPARAGARRLYSESDIESVLRVRRLVDELGVNLAGAGAVLHLRQQVIALQRVMQALRDQLDRNR